MSEQEKKQEEVEKVMVPDTIGEDVVKEKNDFKTEKNNTTSNLSIDDKLLLDNTKVKEIQDRMREVLNNELVEEVLSDNMLHFEFENVRYKVSKPTFRQKQEAYKKQSEKYIELLQVKDENGEFRHKSQVDLKKLYKERGVDVDMMEKKFKLLESKKNKLQIKLGEALVNKASDAETETYKTEIEEIISDQTGISVQITKLIEYSLENQVSVYGYSYLTYLISEKFEDNNWVPVWDSYETYLDTDEKLINQLSFYVLLVTKDELDI